MGINGLWEFLKPYRRVVSLVEIATNEGVIANDGNIRAWRLGIDVSGLFYACNYHRSQAENIPMASIVKKVLCLFSEAPIIPIFVFDGAERPNTKRGKTVRGNAHWLERPLKSLLDSLGLPYHQATGEAEAELAYMSKYHFVDCVLTADSDIFAFGARRVFRLTPETFRDNMLVGHLYEGYPLTGDDFVFISLLVGGDYDQGVNGCGIQTAVQLVATKVHIDLLQAYKDRSTSAFKTFIRLWRLELAKLCRRHSSARVRSLQVPVDFPHANVIDLYLAPPISHGTSPPILSWDTAPHLECVSQFINQHLAWGGDFEKVISRFYRDILPGLVMRSLLKHLLICDDNLDEDFSPLSPVIIGPLIPHANQRRRVEHHVLLKVVVPPQLLILITTHIPSPSGYSFDSQTTKVWIPRGLFHAAQNVKEETVHDRDEVGEPVSARNSQSMDIDEQEDQGVGSNSEVQVVEHRDYIYMISADGAGGETWEIFSDSDDD